MKGLRPPALTELDAERRLRAVQRLHERPSPTGIQHLGEAIHHALRENA